MTNNTRRPISQYVFVTAGVLATVKSIYSFFSAWSTLDFAASKLMSVITTTGWLDIANVIGIGIIAFAYLRRPQEPHTPTLRSSETPAIQLTVLDARPEPAPEYTFKMKLRVEIRNDSEYCVILRQLRWDSNKHGIPAFAQHWSMFQPERQSNESGQGRWETAEVAQVHLLPGQSTLASVALDDRFSEQEIRRRIVSKDTGFLVTQAQMGKKVEEKRIVV